MQQEEIPPKTAPVSTPAFRKRNSLQRTARNGSAMLSESLSSFVIFGCRSLHNRDKRADWRPARLAPGVICGRGKCRVCLRDSVCNAAASSIPEHIGFLVYFHLIPFYSFLSPPSLSSFCLPSLSLSFVIYIHLFHLLSYHVSASLHLLLVYCNLNKQNTNNYFYYHSVSIPQKNTFLVAIVTIILPLFLMSPSQR